MHRIPVIFNPNARSAKAADRLAVIQKLSDRMQLCPTQAPGDAAVIAQRLAAEGHSLIVAAGGDGTVNEVANGLLAWSDSGGALPSLGILPFGTMNVLSIEVGLPKNDPEACWALIEEGQTHEIDVWTLNDRSFLQLAGAGLDAEIIQATTWEQKKSLGPLSYLVSASKLIGKSPTQLTLINPEGETISGKAVILGNGRFYGGPIKAFPRANNRDGLLDVIVLEDVRLWALVKGLSGMYFSEGREMPKGVHYFQTDSLDISSEAPLAVEVDGELGTYSQDLRIRKRQRGLKVVGGLLDD